VIFTHRLFFLFDGGLLKFTEFNQNPKYIKREYIYTL
jgi:hypothetical protein